MPSEDTYILELSQYRKFDKAPFIVYADLESLIVRIVFQQIFQCLQYNHLKTLKEIMMCLGVKIA